MSGSTSMFFFVLLVCKAILASTSSPKTTLMDDCAALNLDGQNDNGHVHLIQSNMVQLHHGQSVLAATTTSTTPPPTGLTLNAVGDLKAFISAIFMNVAMVLGCIGVFCFLRVRYPIMYSYNSEIAKPPTAPSKPDATSYFSWIGASMNTTLEEAIESVGLDNAMLIEFSHLGMKLMAIIGAPMLCIMGPMNCIFGGNAAGQDHLSYLSFGNVENGSWLYWIHAFVVWGVVLTVQAYVYKAQRAFLPRRQSWLRSMAEIRSNTILVENIPIEHQSDQLLKKYFEQLFPGDKVKSAYVAKHIVKLEGLVQALSEAKLRLLEAENEQKKDPDNTPMVRESFMGAKVPAIKFYTDKKEALETEVENERQKVLESSSQPGDEGNNCCNGFVTFHERQDAEHCVRLEGISADQEEWVISNPPEPNDIQWHDLTQDPTAQAGRIVFGYALVAGLYFAYLPCVVGITNVANLVNLGPLQSLWAGVAPTLGLQFMVAFLPTFLILIFQFFFTLKAAAWAQHKLQIWYFWFQIVFVILATAVGQNVTSFMNTLVTDPFALFGVLADTMPYATHFYMNFLVLQWATHSMNIMRYVPLAKFKTFNAIYPDEEDARKMAEPEDQDYYGLGSRSARWSIMLTIGIVYGTLSPPINLLCFINFALCRLVYGYLIVFAETRKPDLGGVFWVSMLKHVFVGNLIYCILMTGVLFRRAATIGPMIIAVPSIFWVLWSMHRFESAFSWEKLPFETIMQDVKKMTVTRRKLDGEYKQPELYKQPS